MALRITNHRTRVHRMADHPLRWVVCTQAALTGMATRSTSIGAAAEEVAALHRLAVIRIRIIVGGVVILNCRLLFGQTACGTFA